MTNNLDQLCINTIRFLSADAVQQANSGHPGMPMGMADTAYVLWTQFLKHNPQNPAWVDRDRFVLSAGHGSMLLYSMLHLTGYDLPLDELKRFRQWESMTPGHPEIGCAPGVETTTGPLGQGFATGVGMALATRLLAARYNQPGHTIVDHHIYAIVSDGDLMEGVASEAASLAGHLGLSEIIYLYDDNKISLVGPTAWSFTEDVGARFRAYNWFVQEVDGYDLEAIAAAIRAAQAETERPSLISVRSHIGYGAPTKQDSAEAHGSPLGDEELDGAKKALGWPTEPRFLIPEEALAHMRAAVKAGQQAEAEWQARFAAYAAAYPELAAEFKGRMAGELPAGWDADLPTFAPGKPMATRRASGQVINALSPQAAGPDRRLGRPGQLDQHAGQRVERRAKGRFHGAQPALWGARARYGRDAERPGPARRLYPLRGHLSRLLRLPAPGDPRRRAVGHARDLRLYPRLDRAGRGRPDTPAGGAPGRAARDPQPDGDPPLGRQRDGRGVEGGHPGPGAGGADLQPAEPGHPGSKRSGSAPAAWPRERMCWPIAEGTPDLILIATGSEVQVALGARDLLAQEGVQARVVAMPCWELFEQQPAGLQGERPARRRDRPPGRRGRGALWVGSLRRPAGGRGQRGPLWRVGAGGRDLGEIWVYGAGGGGAGEGVDRVEEAPTPTLPRQTTGEGENGPPPYKPRGREKNARARAGECIASPP